MTSSASVIALVEESPTNKSRVDAAVSQLLGGVGADGNNLAKLRALIAAVEGEVEGRATPEDFAALAYDRGGALVTAGSANNYVVQTQGRRTTFGAGLALLVKVNRSNTGPAYLAADGMDPRPWLDREGQTFPDGALRPGHYVWAIADPTRDAWISDLFGGLTVALFDAVQRAWWLSLPDDPRGIGPNAPWRNGGIVQWTDENNPAFSIQSPEGRRLTFRLLAEALPTSPDGLAPGEPWLSGDSIALVPQT